MQQVTSIQKRDAAAAAAGDAIGELPAYLLTSLQATTALLSNKVPNMLTEHNETIKFIYSENATKFFEISTNYLIGST